MIDYITRNLSDKFKYRLLEMIPGFLTWSTLILAVVFSFTAPLPMMMFIVLFDFYWLARILYMQTYLLLSYRRMRKVLKEDWKAKLGEIKESDHVMHVVFFPFYNEDYDVIEHTFENLIHSDFPTQKMIVVLGGEGRQREHYANVSARIREKYAHHFYELLTTLHPEGVPGELQGKGSNMRFMGLAAQRFIQSQKLDEDYLIVSAFDSDTCVHQKYFSYLTHVFLTHPNRYRTSYQPIPVFHNNIWDAPSIQRMAAIGTTFWLMTELLRPERLFTFSSHSMSWKALVDVGFWQNDIVTEDSRIFLQGLIEYDGDYSITPLFMPISMDTVDGKNWREGLRNLYKQQRRWAWGVEHFPWMIWQFRENTTIPFKRKFHYVFTILEGMYSWATVPILITILGRLPLAVADDAVLETALAQNLPFILERLLNIALIGLVIMASLSYTMLPKRPKDFPLWKVPSIFLQWIFFPITMVVFGSVPAIEAQTRLMLGKYLGFFVTPKSRK